MNLSWKWFKSIKSSKHNRVNSHSTCKKQPSSGQDFVNKEKSFKWKNSRSSLYNRSSSRNCKPEANGLGKAVQRATSTNRGVSVSVGIGGCAKSTRRTSIHQATCEVSKEPFPYQGNSLSATVVNQIEVKPTDDTLKEKKYKKPKACYTSKQQEKQQHLDHWDDNDVNDQNVAVLDDIYIEGNGPPSGIRNIGNTCYANSVLQVLGQTPNLRESLKRYQKNDTPITSLLIKIIENLNQEKDVNISHVSMLLQTLFKRDRSFAIGRQNDSHSFMLTLFENIQDETGTKALKLFEGTIASRFEYDTCDDIESSEEQLFNSLLLPIPDSHRVMKLEECFDILTKEEMFDEGLLTCKICSGTGRDQTKTRAKKQMVFYKLPNVLVLQLGTFREGKDLYGRTRLVKDGSAIKYDKQLYLTQQQNEEVCYQLYGVVCHHGTLQGGHYVAYVKRRNKWYYCNDSTVTSSKSPAGQTNSEDFLLFYVR